MESDWFVLVDLQGFKYFHYFLKYIDFLCWDRYAGMIDTMHALGDRLLGLGHSTPFLVQEWICNLIGLTLLFQHLGFSYCYSSLNTAREAVKAMGEEIENNGLPKELVPLTFVFTSTGNVSSVSKNLYKEKKKNN